MFITIIQLLIIACCAILAAVLMVLFTGRRLSRKHMAIASLLHGFVITLLCFTVLNKIPGFFSENSMGMELSTLVRKATGETEEDYLHLSRNFILVDNSGTTSLIHNPLGDANDSLVIAVTDRQRLGRLLRYFATIRNQIGQVVIDITFPQASIHDSSLSKAIQDLALTDQIVLARGLEPNCPELHFDSLMFDVTSKLQNGLIVRHELYHHDRPGLPYQVYLNLTKSSSTRSRFGISTETNYNNRSYPVYSGIFPRLNRLQEVQLAQNESRVQLLRPFNIGGLLTEEGQIELMLRLQGIPENIKPVVMIGDFPSSVQSSHYSDKHMTLLGDLSGSLILLNIILELQSGSHRISIWTICFVFAILTLLSYMFLRKVYRQSLDATAFDTKVLGQTLAITSWNAAKDTLAEVGKLLIIALVFVLFDLFSPAQLNTAALLLYIIGIRAVLKKVRFPQDHQP